LKKKKQGKKRVLEIRQGRKGISREEKKLEGREVPLEAEVEQSQELQEKGVSEPTKNRAGEAFKDRTGGGPRP